MDKKSNKCLIKIYVSVVNVLYHLWKHYTNFNWKAKILFHISFNSRAVVHGGFSENLTQWKHRKFIWTCVGRPRFYNVGPWFWALNGKWPCPCMKLMTQLTQRWCFSQKKINQGKYLIIGFTTFIYCQTKAKY